MPPQKHDLDDVR